MFSTSDDSIRPEVRYIVSFSLSFFLEETFVDSYLLFMDVDSWTEIKTRDSPFGARTLKFRLRGVTR